MIAVRMTRRRNDPGGVTPVTADGLSKNEWIRASLEAFARESGAGVLIPSERVLAEQFGVARMTVRGALDALEAASLIRRVPGRGAFVQHPVVARPDVLRSFTEDMILRGMEPGTAETLSGRRPADRVTAEHLGIAEGDPVYSIERVRTADGAPMAVERTTLSAARFPGLLEQLQDDESLYRLLATKYGVIVDSAEQTVSIAHLTAADARRLDVPPGSPCFVFAQVSRDRMGSPVEYGRSLYRGDRYAIKMQVNTASATPAL